jgi:PTEN phosphatase family protein
MLIILIFLDIILIIADILLPESVSSDSVTDFDICLLIFSIVFLIEILVRIFVEMENFFRSWSNVIDTFIVVLSFAISVLLTLLDEIESNNYKFIRILVIIRFVLLIRAVRLLLIAEEFQRAMRLTVGRNKRRYTKHGFDLDLCYITKRVIAMSFPSSGLDTYYRNNIAHVAKFLDEKHPNKYKVYNLCSEKEYDHSFFHGRVERFKIDDHNVPTLKEAIRFVNDVNKWMNSDPENVVAIHCKG